jgi:sterol desaturase/sphingolipid hydroxylase (fatty acid hydroxylase superfamily)
MLEWVPKRALSAVTGIDRYARIIVGWIAWPGLLAGCVLATQIGLTVGQPQIAFALTYLLLGAALFLLQRWMPHSAVWQEKDGELGLDLAHSVASTAAVQGMVAFITMVGVAAGSSLFSGHGFDVWPRGLPLPVQVILGMAVLEFALYWAHRLAHEWRPLWYFHAVHHSVPRLSFVNNGRFHIVDGVKSGLPGLLLLMSLGAPLEILVWQSALGGYIGMLTHSNVAMRFGWLSFIFRANRRPPEEIGVVEAMPEGFAAQILWPFRMLAGSRAITEEVPPARRG